MQAGAGCFQRGTQSRTAWEGREKGGCATDLLLAGAHALGVEVPVRVEVADGHPQVLHSDHGAVGQVWEEEGSRWCELAGGGCGP